jgi:hypothetical protein
MMAKSDIKGTAVLAGFLRSAAGMPLPYGFFGTFNFLGGFVN